MIHILFGFVLGLFSQNNASAVPLTSFIGLFDNGQGLASDKGSQILHLAENSKAIDIEIYEMADPNVRAALRTAIKNGATVRVIKEPKPIGETCDVFTGHASNGANAADCADQALLVKQIGPNFVPFNKADCGQTPGQKGNCFEHGKLFLATGFGGEKVAMISTGNYNSSNLCDLAARPDKCNRDYSLVTGDKDVVNVLQEIFNSDISGKRYDLKALLDSHPEVASKLTVSPFSKAPLIKFIDSAANGCQLQIENQYLKDPEMNEALMRAARRGVKVDMTLASPCTFGPLKPSELATQGPIFNSFEQAGINLKFFTKEQKIQNRDGYMHAKAMTIRGCSDGSADRAWVGSVNGSQMSLDENREYGLFVRDTSQIALLSSIMDKDHTGHGGATWANLVGDGVRTCSPTPMVMAQALDSSVTGIR